MLLMGFVICVGYFCLQINFSRIGTQCLGEEHQRVIKQQKEALAQLRAKLKQLEEAKPPG